jgi:hypothetical protein
MASGQVQVPADPGAVRQHARQGATCHREVVQLGTLGHDGRVEFTCLKPQREGDVQPGDVQLPGHADIPDSDSARIYLFLNPVAKPAQQPGRHEAPNAAVAAIKDPPSLSAVQQFSLTDLIHGMLPAAGDGTAGRYGCGSLPQQPAPRITLRTGMTTLWIGRLLSGKVGLLADR